MNKLRQWYENLTEREQRVVAGGGAALAILILFGAILVPLQSAVSTATKKVDTKRADLEWMRANQQSILTGSTQLPVDTGEPPMVLVDRVAREAGLGSALRGTGPSGTAGVRVQLEAAVFDTLMAWLATLEQQHALMIESVTIDRTAKPGVVNASVTFAQSH